MNPGMIANDTGIVPTYQIQKLDELYYILNIEKNRPPAIVYKEKRAHFDWLFKMRTAFDIIRIFFILG